VTAATPGRVVRARLERILDDLGWLSEQEFLDGAERDEISHLRFRIEEQVDAP
jgi:hypothetical protein